MRRKELTTLRELRTERGVTQIYLAKRLGIHQTALSRLEGRPGTSVSMLKSFVEALGGTLHITAGFPEASFSLEKLAENNALRNLKMLIHQECCVHPIPPERARDRFWVREVDESVVQLEKHSNDQILRIPLRRVSEILPATSVTPPTIVLRGSLEWTAHEKLWRVQPK
jgi:transcriptional regulator with XRE-family HTH domain